MIKVKANLSIAQLVELEAFQTMRKIAKSDLSHDDKASIISDIFDEANQILDIAEGRE